MVILVLFFKGPLHTHYVITLCFKLEKCKNMNLTYEEIETQRLPELFKVVELLNGNAEIRYDSSM
jgi:hypothetical protein